VKQNDKRAAESLPDEDNTKIIHPDVSSPTVPCASPPLADVNMTERA
jgi:hypothetical protein